MIPFFIGIAGPSGAGKSLFCKHMQKRYANTSRLKFDDFFKDSEDVHEIGSSKNWDHPSSIKWNELLRTAEDLKSGSHAVIPNYSRLHNRQIGEKCVFPAPIMLLDGFMTLADPRLRHFLDFSLYFDLSEPLQISRRKERQPWVENHYLHNVMLPVARTHIIPSKVHADVVIDAESSVEDVHNAAFAAIDKAISQAKERIAQVPWHHPIEQGIH